MDPSLGSSDAAARRRAVLEDGECDFLWGFRCLAFFSLFLSFFFFLWSLFVFFLNFPEESSESEETCERCFLGDFTPRSDSLRPKSSESRTADCIPGVGLTVRILDDRLRVVLK